MAWDLEDHWINKPMAAHRMRFVDTSSVDEQGNPARFHVDLLLGSGFDGESCHHCHQTVERALRLNEAGTLVDADGNEVRPMDVAKQYLKGLADFHTRMDNYAGRHGVTVLRSARK